MLYSIAPFFTMTLFNILLVRTCLGSKTKHDKQRSKAENKKRRATFSQLILTMLFLVMTLPTSVGYGVFYQYRADFSTIFTIFDYFLFMHNASVFLRCFVSYRRFRKITLNFLFKIIQPLRICFKCSH